MACNYSTGEGCGDGFRSRARKEYAAILKDARPEYFGSQKYSNGGAKMQPTNQDDEEIIVNVDDVLDIVNDARRESKEQAFINRQKMIRRTIDNNDVVCSLHDLLDLGVKPGAIFDVIRQR